MATNFYKNRRVFISGGAGFIGSVLVDKLISLGATVTIGDNLSTGSIENISRTWSSHGLGYKKTRSGLSAENGHRFILIDFQEYKPTIEAMKNSEIVFHLAANFGGRGYIATHLADCCECFSINQNVMKSAHEVGADRIQFASTACVYPTDLQSAYDSKYLLKEKDAFKNGWGNADETYGWSKLMGEEILKAYHQQYGLKGCSTRYVTAYGPWENDTHALIALIRRAVEKRDPYVIWGSGKQDRDFTYVDDIVSGTLFACEHITDGSAMNIGTGKRYTMVETVEKIFKILDWKPKRLFFDTTKPEGVKTRALSIKKAKALGWKPSFTFEQGLEKTIAWFLSERPKSVETL